MLKVNNLNVHYGVINAVKNVTFDVNEGEIVALIGANGAGKTSIMHALSGLLKSTTGDIFFMDKNINKMPAHKIIAEGLAQVPEGRRIFAQLSVEDNLEMGAYLRTDKIGIERDLENIYNKFPRLKERKHQLAGTLSGGEQQMLAMGRALMSRPCLDLTIEYITKTVTAAEKNTIAKFVLRGIPTNPLEPLVMLKFTIITLIISLNANVIIHK